MVNRSRRTTLKLLASCGIGVGLKTAFATPTPIMRRTIPRSGEAIPAVGLGSYRTFDIGTSEQARKNMRAVLKAFIDLGGRVIDSSPMYGSAEQVIGDLYAQLGITKAPFYATKVWAHGRREGIRQMEASARKLRSPAIDLLQIHNLVDWRTHIKTLYQWRDENRVRYVGITHYLTSAFDALAHVMKTEHIDFVQLPYSVVTREAERRLLPLAADLGIAVLVNEPFEQGQLFRSVRGRELPAWAADFDCHSWAQFFLKFILSHPSVTCPIPATSKLAHLRDNMQAGVGRLPNGPIRKQMAALMDSL